MDGGELRRIPQCFVVNQLATDLALVFLVLGVIFD